MLALMTVSVLPMDCTLPTALLVVEVASSAPGIFNQPYVLPPFSVASSARSPRDAGRPGLRAEGLIGDSPRCRTAPE